MMTILLAALDQTIVGVAVPTIARQLGGFEWMAWVISGYLIASTVVTPLYGKFSDLIGRRRVMSFAIALFLIASVGCALAQTLPQLVLARVLQGAGGGGLIAMAQSVIADVVPLRERGRYQSYVSIVWAIASMLGPVVGGVLTELLSWPWIFWVNLPVGLLALALVHGSLHALPAGGDSAQPRPRIDVLGAALLLVGLTALLVPITRVGQGTAWNEWFNLAGCGLAIALLAAFVAHERGHPQAIVPLGLFRDRIVVACSALLFICFFVFIALSVLVPLRLQLVGGLSPGDAALRLMPLTLAIPVGAFLGGRWLYRTGRVLTLERLGVALVPLGLLASGLLPPTTLAATAALVVIGFGMGLQMPTVLITVQQSVPPAMIGTVTALTSFFRQLGGAVGIAVLSAITLWLLREPPAMSSFGGAVAPAVAGVPATADDAAFRAVMWISALIALLPLWLVTWLPDLRLNDVAPAAADAAAQM